LVRDAGGFTYIGILVAVVILGIGLAGVGQMWRTAMIREQEAELLFAGSEIRKAINTYATKRAGRPDRFPERLEDLVEDNFRGETQHHLRQIYPDPFSGDTNWGLVRDRQERIVGVYSRATGIPIKNKAFAREFGNFETARDYQDWKFVTSVPFAPPLPPPSAGISPSISPPVPQEPEVRIPPAPKQGSRDCDAISAFDTYVCEDQRGHWDDPTAEECLDTARQRHNACMTGETDLPDLYVRHW
jgi:type II secretory pathway pseudopilin PulG